MTPTLTNNPLPMIALACSAGLVAPAAVEHTRTVGEPVGIRADATSSQSPLWINVSHELIRSGRMSKLRDLQTKLRGRVPAVDEYLRAKRLDQD